MERILVRIIPAPLAPQTASEEARCGDLDNWPGLIWFSHSHTAVGLATAGQPGDMARAGVGETIVLQLSAAMSAIK